MSISQPSNKKNGFLDITSTAFLVVGFLTGICSALQTPTLSLYLSTEVNVRPFLIGLFFIVTALAGIFISQYLAGRSDKAGDRKYLIIKCCILGALGCLIYAFSRNYYILISIAVILASLGNTASPQLFALAREYADHEGREAVMFSAILRAQISLAWVIGPPLSFALATHFGFTVMYIVPAVAFVLCSLLVWRFLPSIPRQERAVGAIIETPRQNRRHILLLTISSVLLWSANCSYLITMPLYVVNELGISQSFAGILMGLAAGLEIPVMIISVWIARRFGKQFTMRVAIFSGIAFYALLLFIDSQWGLVALQLLNAIFIGIVVGISMIYFQDLMPGQAGTATTLFSNSVLVGWLVAGSAAGIIAEIWHYHAVFYAALALVILSLLFIWKVKNV